MSNVFSSRLLFSAVVAATALSAQAQADNTLSGVVRDVDGVALQGVPSPMQKAVIIFA